MRKLIILFTALLGLVGAAQAQITTSNVTLFSAQGVEKGIITTTNIRGIKDTLYSVNICISATSSGSLSSIKTYTIRGNDSVTTVVDTITDANSNGGIPSAWWYVKVKLYSAGIVDTVSNVVGPVNVTDSIKKPSVTLVGKPYVDSLGNVSSYAKVTTNGDAVIYWYAAYDSTKVYREQNRYYDTIKVGSGTVNGLVNLVFGNIPLNKTIFCGVKIKNKAGSDSVTATKSDVYMNKQKPSCDIDSVYRYVDHFKVRLRVVGFKLSTTNGLNFRKLGTSVWLSGDSAVITGDSIQYPIINTPNILEPESGYEIQAWSRNALGTSYSVPQTWYTTKTSSPGFFSIKVTKAVAGIRKDLDVNFTVTTANGTTASVTPKFSKSADFYTSSMSASYDINSSTENRSEKVVIPNAVDTGNYFFTMQGMDSKGVQILISDIYTIKVRNWTMGIDPNYQFIDFQTEPGTIYQVFDINGKIVKEGIMVEAHEQISLAELPAGIYVYSLHTGNLFTTGKIIK